MLLCFLHMSPWNVYIAIVFCNKKSQHFGKNQQGNWKSHFHICLNFEFSEAKPFRNSSPRIYSDTYNSSLYHHVCSLIVKKQGASCNCFIVASEDVPASSSLKSLGRTNDHHHYVVSFGPQNENDDDIPRLAARKIKILHKTEIIIVVQICKII